MAARIDEKSDHQAAARDGGQMFLRQTESQPAERSDNSSPGKKPKKRKIQDFFGGKPKRPVPSSQQATEAQQPCPVLVGPEPLGQVHRESDPKEAPLGVPSKRALPTLNFSDYVRCHCSMLACNIV